MVKSKFVNTSKCAEISGLSPMTLTRRRLSGVLIEGVHWVVMPGENARRILWNVDLVLDYIATGGGPSHERACEAYLASLPSNQYGGEAA